MDLCSTLSQQQQQQHDLAMMDAARPASSVDEKKVEEMMMTVFLLDGALGDMVAVSTQRTGLDTADGEEGVWQTVRRAESHLQDNINLWWSVDADYLLDDDVKKKAVVVVTGSVEEGKEEELEVLRRLLVVPPPSSPAVTIWVEEEEEDAIISAAAEEEEEAVAPAAKRIRLFAYCPSPSAAPRGAAAEELGRGCAGEEGAKGTKEDDQEDVRGAPGGRWRQRYARTWRARILYGGRQARGAVPPDRGGARAALRARGVGARD
jgi:hypothetical protein